jgi:hypothetical protein
VANLHVLRESHPGIFSLGSANPQRYRRILEEVSREVYSPAQMDVLRRMRTLYRADTTGRG